MNTHLILHEKGGDFPLAAYSPVYLVSSSPASTQNGIASDLAAFSLVGFDTMQAYRHPDYVARTFFKDSAEYTTAELMGAAFPSSASLGAFAIEALTGDALLATTLLLSAPATGWIVLAAVGIGVISFASRAAGEFVEDLGDVSAVEVRRKVASLLHGVCDHLKREWIHGSRWLRDFYGQAVAR